MHRRVTPLCLASLLLAFPSFAQDFETTCLPEVDAADAVSFAVDARGTRHIARLYRFTGRLEHVQVSRTGSQARIEIAPFISQIADDEVIDTGMALEGNRPWVCVYNAAQDQFEVARLSGAQWVREVVDQGRGRGRWCSLLVDGRTPIVAYGSDDGALRLARREGTNRWRTQIIDAPPGLPVGRAVHLAQVAGVGLVAAHRTGEDRLRLSWETGGIWQSSDPPGPDAPSGASPQVVDAGGAQVWIAHGGPAEYANSDQSLFLTFGTVGALQTFTLAPDNTGGSVGAVRRGEHLLLATREKQRSALFGNADGLTLWRDAAAQPTVEALERNLPGEERHVYRDVHLALDPFEQPVVATSDLTEVQAGSPRDAQVCWYQRVDTDGDGVPDVVEAQRRTDPTLADTDGDGRDDFIELTEGTPARVAEQVPTDPLPYGSTGCVLSDDTFEGAAMYSFVGGARVACQFLDIPVEADALYAIEFAYRLDAGRLEVWPGLGASNVSANGRLTPFFADHYWHRARVLVGVPADNPHPLRAMFRVVDGEGDVADVRVRRLDPDLLPGGHFEFADLRHWRNYGAARCRHVTTHAYDGGGSMACADGERYQIQGITLPPGRYVLTGAAMIQSGYAALRIGNGTSNADMERDLGLYARGGWQTFSRVIDLPQGTDDLRVVVLSYGDVRVDALQIAPAPGATALINGDMEDPLTEAWTAKNGGRCRIVTSALLEGERALACSGRVEARQARLPLAPGGIYRLSAQLDCLSGTCDAEMVFANGQRAYGFGQGVTDGPVPYERIIRVPDDVTAGDLVFSVEGSALLDAIALTPLDASASIVTNGSFESPFALGWRRYGAAGCGVLEAAAWDGGRVLRCVDRGAQQMGIPARPNTRYRLSWRRRGAGRLEVRIGDGSSNGDAFGQRVIMPRLGDAWVLEDRLFTWPANGSADLRLVMRAFGEAQIDDIRLEPLPAGDNLLRDGDFETGILAGWTRYGPQICGTSAAAAFAGSSGAACNDGGFQQASLPVAAGKAYRLRYAYRVDAGTVSVRLGIGTSNVDFEGAGLISGRTNGWQQRDRRIVMPADLAGDARLVFRATAQAAIDRIELLPE